MEQPPLATLTLLGDEIFIEEAKGEGRPYMSIPGVSIVAKLELIHVRREGFHPFGEAQIDKDDWTYSFKLSCLPCPVWLEMFKINLENEAVDIVGDKLSFSCTPANLESRYNKTKEAIIKTNMDFATERERLVDEIKERDRQAAELMEMAEVKRAKEEEQTAKIKEQFDSLKL